MLCWLLTYVCGRHRNDEGRIGRRDLGLLGRDFSVRLLSGNLRRRLLSRNLDRGLLSHRFGVHLLGYNLGRSLLSHQPRPKSPQSTWAGVSSATASA